MASKFGSKGRISRQSPCQSSALPITTRSAMFAFNSVRVMDNPSMNRTASQPFISNVRPHWNLLWQAIAQSSQDANPTFHSLPGLSSKGLSRFIGRIDDFLASDPSLKFPRLRTIQSCQLCNADAYKTLGVTNTLTSHAYPSSNSKRILSCRLRESRSVHGLLFDYGEGARESGCVDRSVLHN